MFVVTCNTSTPFIAGLGKAKGSPSGFSDVKYPEFHNSTEGGCAGIAKSMCTVNRNYYLHHYTL